jgi:hypothetical protein
VNFHSCWLKATDSPSFTCVFRADVGFVGVLQSLPGAGRACRICYTKHHGDDWPDEVACQLAVEEMPGVLGAIGHLEYPALRSHACLECYQVRRPLLVVLQVLSLLSMSTAPSMCHVMNAKFRLRNLWITTKPSGTIFPCSASRSRTTAGSSID